ncbi:L-2-hydroxyglutarate oxidase [Meiothermus granaticius]|uniref:L-2-hydroxyglutarate oxidase LhgO n=1 Tax=Meiothermus granaticius NBRC 107808 TaxID=1227551 RepID=A0A399F9Q3_9DEIN|nr:L-2-hydroxyglutarate oxidase [Meiothermus granaticius]RIH92435.1 L-2-hydroxyglutarate oxidase LhgO [Meiothermus granaticius NBRC 107808]GEM87132.1 aminobutyraldehyde dehydrogenase [Meiothermus granaticius NBRC 107808]
MKTTDYLIIGGGIVGLTIALELKKRHPQAKISVLEKEKELAQHGSGRNSGVLHAGFYYTADSLKARFTRDGNARWKAFVRERGLRLNECGKLVVAKNEAEVKGLQELKRRGDLNGVETHLISVQEAKGIEPRVKTTELALWSPHTATVDPQECMAAIAQECREQGIDLLLNSPYQGRRGRSILTPHEVIEAGFVINAAGLHADQVAHDFGVGQRYRILPFKGLYLYSSEPVGALRTNIYPVPDLRNTFLGVHFTVTVNGHAKIGPTAIPAFWRENYSGLEGFDLAETLSILRDEAVLFFRNDFGFRGLALEELRKYSRAYLVQLASALLEGVHPEQYTTWGRPGIRAQLYDHQDKKLVMDFLLEGNQEGLHVLNAISPAWTASMPFAEYVVDKAEALQAGQALA